MLNPFPPRRFVALLGLPLSAVLLMASCVPPSPDQTGPNGGVDRAGNATKIAETTLPPATSVSPATPPANGDTATTVPTVVAAPGSPTTAPSTTRPPVTSTTTSTTAATDSAAPAVPVLPVHTTAQGSPIQIVWGYKPPTDGTSTAGLASRYSTFVLTRDDEDYRDRLVALGAAPPLMYVRFDAVLQPLGGRPPLKNNVADAAGDVDRLLAQHPDWFLRDGAGNPIIDDDMAGYDAYIMDPGNTGWRNYWIDRVKARYDAEGWNGGIFLDNVELSLKKRVRFGGLPAAYPTDDAYFAAVSGMLKALYFRWGKWSQLPVIANTVESTSGDLARTAAVDQWTSGWLEEGFATSWRSDTWRSQADWEWQLSKVDQAVAGGDRVFLFAQGPRNDDVRETFALASYLLVSTTDRTFFRYVDYTAGYRADWWYANYAAALGMATGPRYRVGATAWRRDFTGGSVTVDPTAHSASINVS